jgi:hypothetical protein
MPLGADVTVPAPVPAVVIVSWNMIESTGVTVFCASIVTRGARSGPIGDLR